MKKFLIVFMAVLLSAGLLVFNGCGGSGGGTKVNSAADEEGQVMDEASKAKKEELPTTYTVEAGDTLATIAEKADIYGNKLQWPLIFDANKDILDDYKTIKEGQKLIIPRNVSAVEIEGAKQRAEELNWPPSENKEAAVKNPEEEGIVAGITAKKTAKKTASSSVRNKVAKAETEMSNEDQPTPIPEPGKKLNKKGGASPMLLILILLGAAALVIWFIISQKKKKDDEEDKEEKSDNILG
jgi:hypothetical protein